MRSKKCSCDWIYGIDFGGTNLRIGRVNPKNRELLGDLFVRGLEDVDNSSDLLKIIGSVILPEEKVGVCAAGKVDEENLILEDSPNSRIKEPIDFGSFFEERKCEAVMTNDMKAAAQAEARFGQGFGYKNVLVATYSSGYNCAVVRNGKNVSTAEFGHLAYKPDGDLFCGCGARGHLEVYVSGNGAAAMAKNYFSMTCQIDHPIMQRSAEDYNSEAVDIGGRALLSDLCEEAAMKLIINSIKAKHVYQAYRENPDREPQKTIRDEQVKAIADSFGKMLSAFNPIEIIVLMGSQTKDWDILFEPAIELYELSRGDYNLPSLEKPSIVRTKLPAIGVQGAAAYFLSQIE